LASFLFVLLLGACDSNPSLTSLRLSGGTMGTTYNITVVVESGTSTQVQEDLQLKVDAELSLINQLMSTYIVDSDLMLLNAQPTGEWVSISTPLVEILALSVEIGDLTEGAFDITVGPLVEIWGFGAATTQDDVPDADTLNRLKELTGYQKLKLNKLEEKAFKTDDIRLDLSAIAKGYAVDRVAQVLENEGIRSYLVEVGGEIRVNGNSARGKPWRIGIEVPSLMQGESQKAIAVTNKGIATSGDYRNFFEVEGVRYSHTLDPRTGWPVKHQLASVTVIAESSAKADSLATGFSVMGVEKAMLLAEKEGIAVFFVQRENDEFVEYYSSAFGKYL